MTDTPGISVGKGDHRKSRELVPAPVIWQYIVYFLVLFASRSGWLMENIAVDMPSAVIKEAPLYCQLDRISREVYMMIMDKGSVTRRL